MSTRSEIIRGILGYINTLEVIGEREFKFDQLSLDTDSCAMSLATDDDPVEVFADVTGVAKKGTIKLQLLLRAVSAVEGDDDIDHMDILSEVVNSIISNYSYDSSEAHITSISWVAAPRLIKVFAGNIRDFMTRVDVNYERMV